jgi:exonuclease III
MWNVQGLRRKAKDLQQYFSDFDIIALTETWMEEGNYAEVETVFPEFKWNWATALRVKQKGRASGGHAIGIRRWIEQKNFNYNVIGSWASVDVSCGQGLYRCIITRP